MKNSGSTLCLFVLVVLCGCGGGESVGGGSGTPDSPEQAYTVLYTFKNGVDGRHPSSGLVRDSAGNLYGTTYTGGASDFGTVFKVDATGKESALYSFVGGVQGPDGSFPDATLIRDAAGNLYGTTFVGGTSGFGTVFKLDTTGKEIVLYSFSGGENGPDGAYPSGLIRDEAGNLYGATQYGGTSGIGTIFKLDATGKYQILHSFTGDFSGPDGAYPFGGLVRDEAGNLYGATLSGGAFGHGAVFRLDAAGTETVLYSFTGGLDGEAPMGPLVRDTEGNFYGTTQYGADTILDGTVFKLNANGDLTTLRDFAADDQGVQAPGRLLLQAGNLYGAAAGGASDVIFRLNIQSGAYTVMYAFTGKSDGGSPNSPLIADNAGNLYGTTFGGGNLTACPPSHDQDLPSVPGCGVVFKLKLP